MINELHIRSLTLYLLAWFIIALITNSIYMIVAMLFLAIFMIYTIGKINIIKRLALITMPIFLLIIIINSLFNQNGSEILLTISLPINTVLNIYRESVLYGISMGTKLVLIITIFAVFNTLVSVDRLFDLFGRKSGDFIFITVITSRLIPYLVKKILSIREIQIIRGINNNSKSLSNRIYTLKSLLISTISSFLEDSIASAEIMYLRGYGSGKRSFYSTEKWFFIDTIFVFIAIIVCIFSIMSTYLLNTPIYYINNILILTLLALPIILKWGGKYVYFRS